MATRFITLCLVLATTAALAGAMSGCAGCPSRAEATGEVGPAQECAQLAPSPAEAAPEAEMGRGAPAPEGRRRLEIAPVPRPPQAAPQAPPAEEERR